MKKISIIIAGLAVLFIIFGITFDFQSEDSLPIKTEPISGIKVETVAENLSIPWSIDWLPDGTILFTERIGNLRAIENGVVQEPLLSLGVSGEEGGMLGVAVDPNFEENNFIYLYYTYNEFVSTFNKLVRYQLVDGIVTEDKVLMDKIPGGPYHDGGRIQFGPDGYLYITTGDAGNPDFSQDLNSVATRFPDSSQSIPCGFL